MGGGETNIGAWCCLVRWFGGGFGSVSVSVSECHRRAQGGARVGRGYRAESRSEPNV